MRLLALALLVIAQTTPKGGLFKTPYSLDEMRNKQAVIETDAGAIVIALLPEAAPNHVGHFMTLAREGAYDGTIFHRVIRLGLIQGGDPLSKDPAKAAQYGTGGLNLLKSEVNAEKHTAGAVSAVLQPNRPDSAGAQFFICASDQPQLDGSFTVFGRVVDGLEVVQKLSAVEADDQGRPRARQVIRKVTIRDTPPVPFSRESAGELAAYRAVLETTKGEITIEFLPSIAPEHVRNFLQLSAAGVYDGTPFHRVVKGFVIQGGALAHRTSPVTASQQNVVRTLQPEFSSTPNVEGTVSMARGEDPASASTSFFICVGQCRTLDGQYTVFGRVAAGMDVVKAIEAVEVEGETPKAAIVVTKVRVERGLSRPHIDNR
jgi:peptidyl-prolyl cis-trans isomerase B (cyclophilin B)